MVQSGAVELTIFLLVKNKTLDDFLETTQEIHIWLSKRTGFKERKVFQDDSGRVFDLVFWDKESQALNTMHKLMEKFADSDVHGLINQRTVNWCVTPVFS